MSSNNIGNFEKGSQGVNLTSFGAGLKRTDLKGANEAEKSIFESIDKDKNGIIDQKELEAFKGSLDNKKNDGVVSNNEAANFLKIFNKGKKEENTVTQQDLLNFLEKVNRKSDNVESVSSIERDGKQVTEVKYKNGITEYINADGSSTAISTNAKGYEVTCLLNEEGHCYQQTYNDEKGNNIKQEFQKNGLPSKTTITDTNNATSTISYDKFGQPAERQDKSGINTDNYIIDASGQFILTSTVQNEGIPAKEIRSNFTYNQDGTITVERKEPDKTTLLIMNSSRTPMFAEITDSSGNITNRTFLDGGYEDTTTGVGGEVYSGLYDNSGNCWRKTVSDSNGMTQTVDYDGQGNTKITVQNGESPEIIAEKFGCTVEDLKSANADKLHGKGFFVGEEIIIPNRQIEPDDPALGGRKTKDETIGDFVKQEDRKAAQKELEEQLKPYGFKNFNGRGNTITDKNNQTYTVIGEAIDERTIALDKNGNIKVIAKDGTPLDNDYAAGLSLQDRAANLIEKDPQKAAQFAIAQFEARVDIMEQQYAKMKNNLTLSQEVTKFVRGNSKNSHIWVEVQISSTHKYIEGMKTALQDGDMSKFEWNYCKLTGNTEFNPEDVAAYCRDPKNNKTRLLKADSTFTDFDVAIKNHKQDLEDYSDAGDTVMMIGGIMAPALNSVALLHDTFAVEDTRNALLSGDGKTIASTTFKAASNLPWADSAQKLGKVCDKVPGMDKVVKFADSTFGEIVENFISAGFSDASELVMDNNISMTNHTDLATTGGKKILMSTDDIYNGMKSLVKNAKKFI